MNDNLIKVYVFFPEDGRPPRVSVRNVGGVDHHTEGTDFKYYGQIVALAQIMERDPAFPAHQFSIDFEIPARWLYGLSWEDGARPKFKELSFKLTGATT